MDLERIKHRKSELEKTLVIIQEEWPMRGTDPLMEQSFKMVEKEFERKIKNLEKVLKPD